VRLSRPVRRAVTVRYRTSAVRLTGGAAEGADYLARRGLLRIRAGRRHGTIRVRVRGDRLQEPNERFLVVLSRPRHARLGRGRAVGTVADDDPAPKISVRDGDVIEGNGIRYPVVSFKVELSEPSGQDVTVDLATADGTAREPHDYERTKTTVRFSPGETNKIVTVPIAPDSLDEETESFQAGLSNPVHGRIDDGQAVGTIVDDDPPPSLAVADASVVEGDSGTEAAVFTVRLSSASGRQVTVVYATADGSAHSPDDYHAVLPATLVFEPGQTARTVTVDVRGDSDVEGSETFLVTLESPVNGTVADGEGIGTIVEDDTLGAVLPPRLPPSTGTIYYVSVTGSDGNPGSEALPWRTVQHAVDSLEPGERAYVRAGIYTENLLYDPTAGRGRYGTWLDPITVQNYPGERPVLRPSAIDASYPLRLKGAYFRFRGFVIENAPPGRLEHVNVYVTAAGNGAQAHHVELSGCEIRNAQSASGMFIDWRAHHVQILGNYVHDNNELGYQHQGIYLESDDSLIANNVTYNHTNGFGIQVRTDRSTGPSGVIVVNNTTVNNSLGGIVIEQTATNTKVVNNIATFNGGSGIRGYSTGEPDPIGTGNEAWNNMAFANGTNFRNDRPGIIDFHDNFVANPLFIDVLLRNYRLLPESPARGIGRTGWTPPTNIEDQPRTIPVSVGAY
jgi:urease beta subunit